MIDEKLEYNIVMDDGPVSRVLGRVHDLDFAAAVYIASLAKYSNRNNPGAPWYPDRCSEERV